MGFRASSSRKSAMMGSGQTIWARFQPSARNYQKSLAKLSFGLVLILILLLTFPIPSLAQNYSFTVDKEVVDAYWESDGTLTLVYSITFSNDPGASPIDFVDIGMHNDGYDLSRISAWVNGVPIQHVEPSSYVDNAFELGLGSNSIQPGQTGTVIVQINGIEGVLYRDSDDSEYASARFSPSWFDSSSVRGTTDLTVVFHLPPGVLSDEPRWHGAPSGFPDTPSTGFDDNGRIVYAWRNPSASASRQYEFGASFPQEYVPAGALITAPSFSINLEICWSLACTGGSILAVLGVLILVIRNAQKRKLDYLPPKISIEGHGIKRGLTAVEAAVLLETPLDRVLTMILFSVVRKGAAKVTVEDPLTLERVDAEIELRPYEKDFLEVLIDKPKNKRRSNLQDLMIDLVKSVQKKMEGFSLKETREYYRSIADKAWAQVEAADTPEVKSEKFEEAIDWTMLDRDFEGRTREVFRTGPVYVPTWWWFVRPSTPAPTSSPSTVSLPSGGSKTVTLPTLPGSTFAASVVSGVQNTASGLVSNLTGFTNGVTKTTNPPPVRTSSGWSGGGGGGCACACACAGCACACAGGGR